MEMAAGFKNRTGQNRACGAIAQGISLAARNCQPAACAIRVSFGISLPPSAGVSGSVNRDGFSVVFCPPQGATATLLCLRPSLARRATLFPWADAAPAALPQIVRLPRNATTATEMSPLAAARWDQARARPEGPAAGEDWQAVASGALALLSTGDKAGGARGPGLRHEAEGEAAGELSHRGVILTTSES
jgi:hypothetical protein